LCPPLGQRREIFGCGPEGRERNAPRLVRKRDVNVRAAGERLEERPLRGGQVLESVGEDGLTVPGVEIALQAIGCAAASRVPIRESGTLELASVCAVELCEPAAELLGIDEPGFEL